MPAPEPLRGEVWDVRFLQQGAHPAVVLSAIPVNTVLNRYAVVPYDESYADVTGLQPVPRSRLTRRRGLLSPPELAQVEQRLRTYLGL